METFVSYLLALMAGLLAVPVAVFFIEVMAAVVAGRWRAAPVANGGLRPRVAVLVPAHNESTGLLPTLADINAQLSAGDRILVVADNCSDDTADVASAAGAEVTARNDQQKIGKGYALEWGLRHLGADPPAIVIIIDADCRLGERAIDRLAARVAAVGRPVQALYSMNLPNQSAINQQVSAFAWRVKNCVRPLGLAALGLPCQLMGTGMAFPWGLIRAANLASEQIVEDLGLGLDLARMGHAPLFCPDAEVMSQFPVSAEAADRQRQRWEHGHVDMILARAPPLIATAIARRDLDMLALAFDLAVPPLTLLAMLTIGMLALAGLAAWLLGSCLALAIAAVSFTAFAAAVFLSWLVFARDILPPGALWSIGLYALQKLQLYWRYISGGRVSQWIRTDRE